jgi:hypothetical protein
MGKDKRDKAVKVVNNGAPVGFVLFVAWFGALVYFINHANGFWEVVLAFLKACVWPAIVLYHVLQTLGA